jgi:hypothetical protein
MSRKDAESEEAQEHPNRAQPGAVRLRIDLETCAKWAGPAMGFQRPIPAVLQAGTYSLRP